MLSCLNASSRILSWEIHKNLKCSRCIDYMTCPLTPTPARNFLIILLNTNLEKSSINSMLLHILETFTVNTAVVINNNCQFLFIFLILKSTYRCLLVVQHKMYKIVKSQSIIYIGYYCMYLRETHKVADII